MTRLFHSIDRITQELLVHALFFALDAVVVFALPYDGARRAEVVARDQNSTTMTFYDKYPR